MANILGLKSQQAYAYYETGRGELDVNSMREWAEKLGVNYKILLGEIEPTQTPADALRCLSDENRQEFEKLSAITGIAPEKIMDMAASHFLKAVEEQAALPLPVRRNPPMEKPLTKAQQIAKAAASSDQPHIAEAKRRAASDDPEHLSRVKPQKEK